MPRVDYIRIACAPPTTVKRERRTGVRHYAFPLAVLLTPSHEQKRLERLVKMAGGDR